MMYVYSTIYDFGVLSFLYEMMFMHCVRVTASQRYAANFN